jgi:hypothetical protein
MTLREVFNKYLAWCPRFTSISVQTPPFGSLPLGGKVAVVILLATWGVASLVMGFSLIPAFIQMLRQTIVFDPVIVSYGVLYTFPALQGAVLLLLLLDYVSSPTIRRRHRAELAILLGLQVPRLWSIGFPDLFSSPIRGGGGFSLGVDAWIFALAIVTYLLAISESLLALYLIKRLLFDKAVLTKWTFLLVFTVFFSCFAQNFVLWLNDLLNSNPSISLPMIANSIVFVAAAIFSFRTFTSLRGGKAFELVLPSYFRISVIFYALVEGAYQAWNSYISADLAFSFNPVEALFIVLNVSFYVGLIAVCVFPPRIVVGEVSTATGASSNNGLRNGI